ncbi:MAG: carbohydrate ABC transporter permease [Pseudomonadota bacterium]
MKRDRWSDHAVLLLGAVVLVGPLIVLCALSATPGGLGGAGSPGLSGLSQNIETLNRRVSDGPDLWAMTGASLQVALSVAMVTTLVGFLAAFAMTQFSVQWVFGLTLLTLYFPVEARMLPTFDVANTLGLIDTLPGLVLPILPLAVATFYLRQHFLTLPPELAEAAQIDGAGPFKFMVDFVLPLSLVPVATVFVIAFILGWNQYLWPLMISVNDVRYPLMRGLNLVGTGSGASMVIAVTSLGPPLVLMVLLVWLRKRQPI